LIVPRAIRQRQEAWGVDELLRVFRELSLRPDVGDGLIIAGDLEFSAGGRKHERLTDAYAVRIKVPNNFPRRLPRVYETGGRIPEDFHKLSDQALCLGAMVRLRLAVGRKPTLLEYVNNCVVPYLYGYTYYLKHGKLPFGELGHEDEDIVADLQRLFRVDSGEKALRLLMLGGLERHKANRRPCPCGTGLRVGECHHLQLNRLRQRCGRLALRAEFERLTRKRRL